MTRLLTIVRGWVDAAGQRPLTRRNHAGAMIAMLTCPCHLGVAIALTSGTALGGWLVTERAWLAALLTVAFAFGLMTLFRRDSQACDRCDNRS
jgi:cytochrome c biogenesis protein CcdA